MYPNPYEVVDRTSSRLASPLLLCYPLRPRPSSSSSSASNRSPTSGRAIRTKAILPRSQARKSGRFSRFWRVEPFGPRAVEDRPEAADLVAADAGAVVDHQAGDHLRGAPAQHAGLGFVDREPFVLGDVPDPRHQVADAVLQGLIARERQVVGVSGIGQPELGGEPGQPAIEPAGDLVRQAGTGAGPLGQSARAGGDVIGRAFEDRPSSAGTRCRGGPGSWPRPASSRRARRPCGPGGSRCWGRTLRGPGSRRPRGRRAAGRWSGCCGPAGTRGRRARPAACETICSKIQRWARASVRCGALERPLVRRSSWGR